MARPHARTAARPHGATARPNLLEYFGWGVDPPTILDCLHPEVGKLAAKRWQGDLVEHVDEGLLAQLHVAVEDLREDLLPTHTQWLVQVARRPTSRRHPPHSVALQS